MKNPLFHFTTQAFSRFADLIVTASFALLAPCLQSALIITEIQSSQASTGKNDFWELTNIGAEAVNLGGWKWDDDSRNPADAAAVTIPAGTTIAPGESIVFTGLSAATFRTWWAIASTVQVVSTGAAPGLGSSDAVALFDSGGTERAYLSYAAGGFTKSDGGASAGGQAGASAGGSATASVIWDPVHGTTARRYRFRERLEPRLGRFRDPLRFDHGIARGDAVLQ